MERKEIMQSDGLYHCSICGEPTQQRLYVPLFDGTGRKQEMVVHRMCKCQQEEEDRKEKQRKYDQDMRVVNALKAESLMDARFENARLANYRKTDGNGYAYEIACRYVNKFADLLQKGQGLLFMGDVGTGKSYTAACIANELMYRKYSAIMTSFIKILAKSGNAGVSEYTVSRLVRPSLLVLDDLGAERSTEYAIESVYNIIDSRYRSGKPLIITTNLTLLEMKDPEDMRYRRIYDRIFEACYPVQFKGKSFRKISAVQRFDEMRRWLE